ncbi:hypothetical protein BN1708_015279 [Verticillium longisporum]|uniref:Uncharacterized protein n=1 Tax=Verticillium longisporum TaxID=100787 RepID=A0A0G4M2V3_VERLO|nr:hypothetical protein BN1708_015279 [Verticillium longisporum]
MTLESATWRFLVIKHRPSQLVINGSPDRLSTLRLLSQPVLFGKQLLPDRHQRSSQEVLPPILAVGRRGLFGTEADAPDAVRRTRLDEIPTSRSEQPLAKQSGLGALRELEPVPLRDDAHLVLIPNRLVKASHLAAQGADLTRVRRLQNAGGGGRVKEEGLVVHHVVLG